MTKEMESELNTVPVNEKYCEVTYKTPYDYINTVSGIYAGVNNGKLYYDVDTIDQYKREYRERMSINLGISEVISLKFFEKQIQESDE